jgi:hypothetical protein
MLVAGLQPGDRGDRAAAQRLGMALGELSAGDQYRLEALAVGVEQRRKGRIGGGRIA